MNPEARVVVAGASGFAGALAALEVIDDPELLRGARELGARLAGGLRELDGIAEVRGRGLMVGGSLADGRDANGVARRALDEGLVINVPRPGMLRFLPPLTIAAEEVETAIEIVRHVTR
jgi:acetylornithine/N-succinyldiaminopimelate aminotransferase